MEDQVGDVLRLMVLSSMMPKVTFGNLAATSLTAGAYTKPTPMTGL